MRQINACHEPPANVHLMKAALVEMTKPTLEGVDNPEVAKKGKMWKREYEGEATYMHFYEEMVENEREWLEVSPLQRYAPSASSNKHLQNHFVYSPRTVLPS